MYKIGYGKVTNSLYLIQDIRCIAMVTKWGTEIVRKLAEDNCKADCYKEVNISHLLLLNKRFISNYYQRDLIPHFKIILHDLVRRI